MYIILTSAIIVNILTVIVFLIGLFHKFEQPKNKAMFGYTVVGSMLIYIILLGFIAIYELLTKHNLYSLILFLFVILPFIIGRLVNYNSLKKYTTIQILCCLASLIILLIL